MSENISVRSIVGNFLEHARVFYFENNGNPEFYCSSADWMPRNLERRVEILFPVEAPALKEKLWHILEGQLRDNKKAHILKPDGSYEKADGRGKEPYCAQEVFCKEAQEMSVKKNIGTHGYSFRKPMWKWSKDMQKEQNVRLVLASASPRRRELLSQIGLEFTVMPSTKEENAKTTEAGALVQELSRQKAVDIWEQLSGGQGQNPDADQEQIAEETQEPNLNGKRQPELLVIGADTVVCCEGKILGKPHSREAAAEMLTALQGRSHEVYTGVTLYSQSETVTFSSARRWNFIR